MATNLEKLDLSDCSSLVDLPSSIQYLNKLEKLIIPECINLETFPSGINLQSLWKLHLWGCSKLRIFPDISTNLRGLCLNETSIEQFPNILHLKKLVSLQLCRMKSDKFWERVEPLTPLMNMVPLSLKCLYLSDIPCLVELPSSIQNFSELVCLEITECTNLETLPTGINFRHLVHLNLSGCSRLKTFPDISTNIFGLYLSRTGIEEVPWWIKNFSQLTFLEMSGCDNLQYVSPHILELEDLMADFSNCRALSIASLLENALFQDVFFKVMILSGEQVPSYFTHHTTGNSLTNIPILHTSPSQRFFKFRACAIVDSESSPFHIHVSCRFEDRLGIHLDSSYVSPEYHKAEKGINLVIFECSFPLDEDMEQNYEHMDVDLHVSNHLSSCSYSTSKLKGWGIRLFDGLDNKTKDNEDSKDDSEESGDDSEESGDDNVMTERSLKRTRERPLLLYQYKRKRSKKVGAQEKIHEQ